MTDEGTSASEVFPPVAVRRVLNFERLGFLRAEEPEDGRCFLLISSKVHKIWFSILQKDSGKQANGESV